MTTTLMRAEIDEAPAAVRRLLSESAGAIAEAGARLRALDPKVIVTVARGSSDHAATFFKYACEITPERRSPRSAPRSPRSMARRCGLPGPPLSASRNRARARTSSR